MSTLIKNKTLKLIILIPTFLVIYAISTNIIFNLGVHLGTIARYTSEGVCCM